MSGAARSDREVTRLRLDTERPLLMATTLRSDESCCSVGRPRSGLQRGSLMRLRLRLVGDVAHRSSPRGGPPCGGNDARHYPREGVRFEWDHGISVTNFRWGRLRVASPRSAAPLRLPRVGPPSTRVRARRIARGGPETRRLLPHPAAIGTSGREPFARRHLSRGERSDRRRSERGQRRRPESFVKSVESRVDAPVGGRGTVLHPDMPIK